jgi:hypothetical protein
MRVNRLGRARVLARRENAPMKEAMAKTMGEALGCSFNRCLAGLARVETFPGAACCRDLRSYTRREEYREVFELYAKAAPLQALGHSQTP